MKYRALLIGLGNIAQGYDKNTPDSCVLTHAKAFYLHPGFELYAGIDPDQNKQAEFSRRYCCRAFSDMAELPPAEIDVVAICSPTQYHFHHFQQAIELSPQLILCEKPLSDKTDEALAMVRLAAERKVSLCVNYIRRFEPGANQLKKIIDTEQFGKLLSGMVWFKRGMLNNASHFVDLLIYLFGIPDNSGAISATKEGEEVSVFFLQWGAACVIFSAVDEAEYNYFEMELVGSKQRASYCDGGERIYVRNLSSDSDISERSMLAQRELMSESDFLRYQHHVQDAIYRHLEDGDRLPSTGETALSSLEIICDLKKRLHEGVFV